MRQFYLKFLVTTALLLSSQLNVFALDFGPFTLRGFGLVQFNYATNQCEECQQFPDEDRQRIWADWIVAGKEYKPKTTVFSLFQPYLELRTYLSG